MSLEIFAKALFDASIEVTLTNGTETTLTCEEVSFEYRDDQNSVFVGSISKDAAGFELRYVEPRFESKDFDNADEKWGLEYDTFAIRGSFGSYKQHIREIRDIHFHSDVLQIFYFVFAPTHIVYEDNGFYQVPKVVSHDVVLKRITYKRPFLRQFISKLQSAPYENCYLMAYETNPRFVFVDMKDEDVASHLANELLTILNNLNLNVTDDGVIQFFANDADLKCEIEFDSRSLVDVLHSQLADIEMCYWNIMQDKAYYFHKQEELVNSKNQSVTVITYTPASAALESLEKLYAFQDWALKAQAQNPLLVMDTSNHIEEIFYVLFATTTLTNVIQWNMKVMRSTPRGAPRTLPKFLLVLDPNDPPEIRYLKCTVDFRNSSTRIYNTAFNHTLQNVFFAHPVWLYEGDDVKSQSTSDGVDLRWIQSRAFDFRSIDSLPQTCFDVSMLDDSVQVNEYLQESIDNLVFVFESASGTLNATCMTRESLRLSASVFYPCLKPHSMEDGVSVQYDTPIIRLMINTFPIHITQPNMDSLTKQIYSNNHQVFVISELPEMFPYTISETARLAREEDALVSADHCQDGTSKRMYTIQAVQN